MRLSVLTFLVALGLFLNGCGEAKAPQSPAPSPTSQEATAPEDAAPDTSTEIEPTPFDFYVYSDLFPEVKVDKVSVDHLELWSLGNTNYYVITTKGFLNDQLVVCSYHYEKTETAAPQDILDLEEHFAAINSDPGKRSGSSTGEVRTQSDYCNDFAESALANIEGAGAQQIRSDQTDLIQARWNHTGL